VMVFFMKRRDFLAPPAASFDIHMRLVNEYELPIAQRHKYTTCRAHRRTALSGAQVS
jgi:hypothetical protein